MSDDPEHAWKLLDLVPAGVVMWRLADDDDDDYDLQLRYANLAACELTSTNLREHIGEKIRELWGGQARIEHVGMIAATCRDGLTRVLARFPYHTEASVSPEGRPLPATSHMLGGKIIGFGPHCAAVVIESVAELARAEAEARNVSKFVDSIIEHLPAMVFVKDAQDLRFVRFNRAGEELLGVPRTALLDKSDHDLFPHDQADAFVAADREALTAKALREIPHEPIETPHGRRWLHTRKIPILDDSGEPRYLLGVSIDITDQKRAEEVLRSSHEALEQRVRERTAELERQIAERERAERALAETEEQLRHAQKMEAMGRLAGGVAHDFNNLLSVVLGYSELVLKNLPLHSPVRKHVDQINRAGQRASDLTRQLLAFSRRQVLTARTLDLNEIVLGLENMVRRIVGEDIELTFTAGSELHCVRADPSQVEQVLMNLVVNARDAMPDGGKLSIATRNVELDGAFVAANLGAKLGPHVQLTVQDSGIGMERATLKHIFEPFFTTKEKGKGTGLGLSTVFGITQQSGGVVTVESAPGRGARFDVYFPAVERTTELPRAPIAPEKLRGSETILLVEDEEQVRKLAAIALRDLGYRVIEAANAAEAIARVTSFHGKIDLLLTDVVMPGMGGPALAAQLREQAPDLRVLFMSGYTDDAVFRHGVLESGTPFLHKPITPNVLALRTREVLDREPQS